MFEAKVAMMMRPSARSKTRSRVSRTIDSEGPAGALGVGAVREQGQHARLAQPGQLVDVGGVAHHRREVELVLGAVHDRAQRRVDGVADGVRNRVRHPDRLDPEGADLDHVVVLHGMDHGRVQELVLLEPHLDQAAGQPRGVDRRRRLRQHVPQRTVMVLVPVGDEVAQQVLDVLGQVGEVRQDQVDARHVALGEHQATVDHDHGVAVLDDGHVAADLAQAAERDDLQLLVQGRSFLWGCIGTERRPGLSPEGPRRSGAAAC